MVDEAPGKLWHVVDQTRSTRVSPAGRFQEIVQVTIETASGVEWTFDVPLASYSEEVVKGMADAWAAEVERVQSL